MLAITSQRGINCSPKD